MRVEDLAVLCGQLFLAGAKAFPYPKALRSVDLKHSLDRRPKHEKRYHVTHGWTYMLQQDFLSAKRHAGGL